MGELKIVKNIHGDEYVFHELRNREFFIIKSICKRYFKIDGILSILKHNLKKVYKVITKEDGVFKIKIYNINDNKALNQIEYANLFSKKINIPNEIGVVTTPTYIFRATKWIKGSHVDFRCEQEDIFNNIGKLIADINNIKDLKSEKRMMFNKLDEKHIILANDGNIYFVGDNFELVDNIYKYVVSILNKYLKDKKKIKLVLMGYKVLDRNII